MKIFLVFAVAFAICGSTLAGEDMKAKILAYWKCLSCNEDPLAREEFMKCWNMKPEKCKEASKECSDKYIPGEASTSEERWAYLCKNEDAAEKIFDCIKEHEHWKDLTDEEKDMKKAFIKCSKAVNAKFCDIH